MENLHYQRFLSLDLPKKQSIFLWGARKTGKSTFLKTTFPESPYIDFLKHDIYLKYLKTPSLFREEMLVFQEEGKDCPIIVDEIQKVPELLDEIHWLIENTDLQFILCGSSARKLKQKGVNLLGGRAWKFSFFPLVYPEINDFDLLKVLNHGTVPAHYQTKYLSRMLKAYIEDYLIQEVKSEGLVRNLQYFARFIEAASFSNGELLNYTNISRDCGIDVKTVKEYFYILEDTLVGYHLYPYTKKNKRDVLTQTPKFYFFDTGVVGALSRKRIEILSGIDAGHRLETYIHHELKAYLTYQEIDKKLSFWRTRAGHEVDFVIGDTDIGIEVKISDRIRKKDLLGLWQYLDEYPQSKALLVCQEKEERIIKSEEGKKIHVYPIEKFLKKLWAGKILSNPD